MSKGEEWKILCENVLERRRCSLPFFSEVNIPSNSHTQTFLNISNKGLVGENEKFFLSLKTWLKPWVCLKHMDDLSVFILLHRPLLLGPHFSWCSTDFSSSSLVALVVCPDGWGMKHLNETSLFLAQPPSNLLWRAFSVSTRRRTNGALVVFAWSKSPALYHWMAKLRVNSCFLTFVSFRKHVLTVIK